MKFNDGYIQELARKGKLLITTAFIDDEPVIFHAYIFDDNVCELMYSTSIYSEDSSIRNMIGNNNKALHWKDILYFKEHNVSIYDWGGINNPSKPSGISKFKLAFCNQPIEYYHYIVAFGFVSKIVLKLFKIKERKNEEFIDD